MASPGKKTDDGIKVGRGEEVVLFGLIVLLRQALVRHKVMLSFPGWRSCALEATAVLHDTSY